MAKEQESFIDWNEVAREEDAKARVEEVKRFAPMAGDGPAPDPSDVDALIEPEDLGNLEYNGLDEHLLQDFLTAKRKKEAFEKLEEELKARITKALGKERGDIIRGKHIISAKDVAPRKSVDWEQYFVEEYPDKFMDVIGEIRAKYTKPGKPSLRIEVREVK